MSEEFLEPPITPPPEPEIPPPPDTNQNFVHYDEATGAVFASGHCPESALEVNSLLYPDLGFLETPDKVVPETQMVDIAANPPVVVSRPVFPIVTNKTTIQADGSDTATISGIPAGTTVTLLGTGDFAESSEVVNSGSTAVTTVVRTPMVFRFEKFPYRVMEMTINGV